MNDRHVGGDMPCLERYWDKPRQHPWYFDAHEPLGIGTADDHGQVQAEIRDEGKGVAGVEGQRGEHGLDLFEVIPVGDGPLRR